MLLDPLIEPWIVPLVPPLERLAMQLADSEGAVFNPLPSAEKGGIVLGNLPPFLIWKYIDGDNTLHLFFFQPREIGSLVKGANRADMSDWGLSFPLVQMRQLLSLHPDIGKSLEVTCVQVDPIPLATVRSTASMAPVLGIVNVLNRISPNALWNPGLIRLLRN